MALLTSLVMAWVKVSALSALALALYTALVFVYNIFLHPLRNFPGPLLARATRLHWGYQSLSGQPHTYMREMHRQYGDIVRIAPDELAFAQTSAWKDIQGHRTGGGDGGGDLEKSMKFFRAMPVELAPLHIGNSDRAEHAVVRRMMAHGFSERNLRDQQRFIAKYIDLLVQRLHERGAGGAEPVDIACYYNFTTFDVIGELTFGEPFGGLDSTDYHPWVKVILASMKAGSLLQLLGHYPSVKNTLLGLVPTESRKKHNAMLTAKMIKRLELGADRPDLVEGLLKTKDDFKLSLEHVEANAGVIIVAGSETTATVLSAATYLLLRNNDKLERLVQEIRSAFKSEEEIDYTSVSKLPYLLACLDESLRIYPPVAAALPRVTPPEGATIADQFIPGNTIVGMHHWALYHSDKHFALPDEFIPERWLGDDPRFADDDKAIFHPFSLGPRSCIGRNLAYIEMRIILARVLWNFDLTLADDSRIWMEDQKLFIFWDRGPLNVYLKPVLRE